VNRSAHARGKASLAPVGSERGLALARCLLRYRLALSTAQPGPWPMGPNGLASVWGGDPLLATRPGGLHEPGALSMVIAAAGIPPAPRPFPRRSDPHPLPLPGRPPSKGGGWALVGGWGIGSA